MHPILRPLHSRAARRLGREALAAHRENMAFCCSSKQNGSPPWRAALWRNRPCVRASRGVFPFVSTGSISLLACCLQDMEGGRGIAALLTDMVYGHGTRLRNGDQHVEIRRTMMTCISCACRFHSRQTYVVTQRGRYVLCLAICAEQSTCCAAQSDRSARGQAWWQAASCVCRPGDMLYGSATFTNTACSSFSISIQRKCVDTMAQAYSAVWSGGGER